MAPASGLRLCRSFAQAERGVKVSAAQVDLVLSSKNLIKDFESAEGSRARVGDAGEVK